MDPWVRMLILQVTAIIQTLVSEGVIKLDKKSRQAIVTSRDGLNKILGE